MNCPICKKQLNKNKIIFIGGIATCCGTTESILELSGKIGEKGLGNLMKSQYDYKKRQYNY